jgi:hypothetical protein
MLQNALNQILEKINIFPVIYKIAILDKGEITILTTEYITKRHLQMRSI